MGNSGQWMRKARAASLPSPSGSIQSSTTSSGHSSSASCAAWRAAIAVRTLRPSSVSASAIKPWTETSSSTTRTRCPSPIARNRLADCFQRQPYGEGAALPLPAVDRDGAAVQLHHVLGIGQADAGAGNFLVADVAGALKTLEDRYQ